MLRTIIFLIIASTSFSLEKEIKVNKGKSGEPLDPCMKCGGNSVCTNRNECLCPDGFAGDPEEFCYKKCKKAMDCPLHQMCSDFFCREACPPITESEGLEITCEDPFGFEHKCDEGGVNGTRAFFQCKKFYKNDASLGSGQKFQEAVCVAEDRKWFHLNSLTACTVDCGLLNRSKSRNKRGKGRGKLTRHWPWHGSLFQNDSGIFLPPCGATLISKNVAMTAAICVSNIDGELFPVENFKIVFGSAYNDFNLMKKEKSAQIFSVKDVVVPGSYSNVNYYSDIALIRLSSSVVQTDFVRPVCIPKYDVGLGTVGISPGTTGYSVYGHDKYEKGKFTFDQKELKLEYLDKKSCLEHGDSLPNDSQFCSQNIVYENSVCNDNIGNGFFIPNQDNFFENRFVIHGIVSFAGKDGPACTPTGTQIMTNVAHYSLWIQSVIDRFQRNYPDLDDQSNFELRSLIPEVPFEHFGPEGSYESFFFPPSFEGESNVTKIYLKNIKIPNPYLRDSIGNLTSLRSIILENIILDRDVELGREEVLFLPNLNQFVYLYPDRISSLSRMTPSWHRELKRSKQHLKSLLFFVKYEDEPTWDIENIYDLNIDILIGNSMKLLEINHEKAIFTSRFTFAEELIKKTKSISKLSISSSTLDPKSLPANVRVLNLNKIVMNWNKLEKYFKNSGANEHLTDLYYYPSYRAPLVPMTEQLPQSLKNLSFTGATLEFNFPQHIKRPFTLETLTLNNCKIRNLKNFESSYSQLFNARRLAVFVEDSMESYERDDQDDFIPTYALLKNIISTDPDWVYIDSFDWQGNKMDEEHSAEDQHLQVKKEVVEFLNAAGIGFGEKRFKLVKKKSGKWEGKSLSKSERLALKFLLSGEHAFHLGYKI